MEKRLIVPALRGMLREQLCCIGRIAARHQLPDDAVWEIAKGFEVIYRHACKQAQASVETPEADRANRRTEPHPGLTELLTRLERETEPANTSSSPAAP
jgi:hypothetical protein